MPQCAGKSRRSGEQCRQQTEPDRKYCRFHGGRAPRGIDHHATQKRIYDELAPSRMQGDLLRIATAPDLLALVDELVLLRARAADILKRVDSGESGKAWRDLQSLVDKFEGEEHGSPEQWRVWRRIRAVVSEGNQDWATWGELQGVIRDVTKLAESQRRYRLEQQHMLSTDAAYAMMTNLVEVVLREVPDERVHQRIADEFARLAGRANLPAAALEAEVIDAA